MRQAVLKISGLCIIAAFCGQLLQKNRFNSAVRLMLGLELARTMLALAADLAGRMLKWS